MQNEPIRVLRRSWCEDSDAAVAYFQQAGIQYTEVDIEEDQQAGDWVKYLTGGHHITPTYVYRTHAAVLEPWDQARFERWWQSVNQDTITESQ
ncbi:MAG: hypothetical protein M3437_05865 [Chloroflexota bacterium]|nr:hypothetical protein [Chloroflexota bacterium]MDQ5867068.1 hypothetical protein [Chloroflexota bacterium]